MKIILIILGNIGQVLLNKIPFRVPFIKYPYECKAHFLRYGYGYLEKGTFYSKRYLIRVL